MTLSWDPGYGPLVETRLRVVTWNLWGRWGLWEPRQPVILESLRRLDADIVCLQEAWEDDERSQPRELAAALGMSSSYSPGFRAFGAWSGNAVLSRWPIRREETIQLPMEGGGAVDTDQDEARTVRMVEVDGPRGPIQVFCTHLSWREDWSGVRQEQVRTLCRFIASTRPRSFPAVVCGDLNAEPDSEEIRMLTGLAAVPVPGVVLRDAWKVGGEGRGETWCNSNSFAAGSLDLDRRIDYILTGVPKQGGVGQVMTARVVGNEPIDGVYGSDHFGVLAELRY